MTSKFPVVSGGELIRAREKFGYIRVRQKGSHVQPYRSTETQRVPVTVSLHAEVAFGTLKRILRDTRLTAEQLISVL
jgi:predicted RNA binding protein YcfA (HicA-like mRNA interferase family)